MLRCFLGFRSSHQRCSMKKGVLRNSSKFTGKHLRQSLYFNKVEASGLQLYWKRDSGTGVFPVNFAKFLRTPLFAEHLWTTALEGWENRVLQKIEFFKTEFYFYSLSIKACLHRGCFFFVEKVEQKWHHNWQKHKYFQPEI